MLVVHLAAAIGTAPLRTLDDLSRDIWKAHTGGLLSDTEAQELAESIHHRRQAQKAKNGATPLGASARTPAGTPSGTPPGTASGTSSANAPRPWSYFPAKRPQRSPDATRSLERRRTLAASGPLPPALACKFTTGELAVLKLVSDEVQTKGTCVLSIPELAARAGVGTTKARMALRIAASLGLVTIEERRVHYRPNLTNVVRIVSGEWLAWLGKRKPRLQSNRPQTTSGHWNGSSPSNATFPRGEGSLPRRPRSSRVYDDVSSSGAVCGN